MTPKAKALHYSKNHYIGVIMKLALLGRQALMGVMAVALVAGMSVKTFAAEGLLNKVKERGTLLVGLEGTYPPFSFQGDDGKLTGFEVEFAEELAKHLGVKASLKPTKWDGAHRRGGRRALHLARRRSRPLARQRPRHERPGARRRGRRHPVAETPGASADGALQPGSGRSRGALHPARLYPVAVPQCTRMGIADPPPGGSAPPVLG